MGKGLVEAAWTRVVECSGSGKQSNVLSILISPRSEDHRKPKYLLSRKQQRNIA